MVYAKSIRKFKSETFDSVKLVDENDVEFTKAKEFEVDSCPGGPMKKDGKFGSGSGQKAW